MASYFEIKHGKRIAVGVMTARIRVSEGRVSSVGITTRYATDGSGFESRWGEIFHTCPDRPWDLPNFLYNGYRVFPWGKTAGARR